MRKLKWLPLYLAVGWQVPIQAQTKASDSSQKPQTIPTCFDLSWDGHLVLTGGKNGQVGLWGVKQRFQQAQKTGRYFASWARKRMSFSAALDQGLFAKEMLWYANQDDIDIVTLTKQKYRDLSREEKRKRYLLMQKQVQQNLENFIRE